jgi:hypothetical protein
MTARTFDFSVAAFSLATLSIQIVRPNSHLVAGLALQLVALI